MGLVHRSLISRGTVALLLSMAILLTLEPPSQAQDSLPTGDGVSSQDQEIVKPEEIDPNEAIANDQDKDKDPDQTPAPPIPTLGDRCAADTPDLATDPTLPPVEAPEVTTVDPSQVDPSQTKTANTEAAAEDPEPEPEPEPDSEPASAPELDPKEAERIEAEKARAAEEKALVCKLHEGDRLYQSGQKAEARAIYQAAKPAFDAAVTVPETPERPAPIKDPQALSPAGQVFLREAAAGQEQHLETRILVPLSLLVEKHPEYIPGHGQYAEALVAAGDSPKALAVLENATRLYPNEAALVKARVQLASQQGHWMDAAMIARQFAQLNADHPEAPALAALADENLKRYQGDVRDTLTANTIANVITGAASYAITGSIWNSLGALQTTTLMLRGEKGVGNSISKSVQQQIPLVEDEELVTYVSELGQKLAKVAGRNEFEYEFFVLLDENLNAFALPGGKVFVNVGAIAQTRSEAELAGLLSHELSHAVLSHGFQLVSNGSLLSDVSRFIPYGGLASNLVVLNYSRDMERQADELGTQILVSAGYPSDGLRNLMETLGEEEKERPLFAWLSTHPETDERVHNIERQIQAEGFDRYGFEGVERHDRMREKARRLIEVAKKKAEEEQKNRPWWR